VYERRLLVNDDYAELHHLVLAISQRASERHEHRKMRDTPQR
jgi:hypothetical protein